MVSRRAGAKVLVGWGTALLLGGCSSVSPVQVGQTAGGLAGAAIAPGIGMPVGALVGTLAGLVVEQQLDKLREQRERVELNQQLQGQLPPQREALHPQPSGEPARVWVDERVEGGRLLAGHFEVQPL